MWWQPASITCLLTCCSMCWYRLHILQVQMLLSLGCCHVVIWMSCLPKNIFSLLSSSTSVFHFSSVLFADWLLHCYYTILPNPVSRQMINMYSQLCYWSAVWVHGWSKKKINRVKQRLVLDYFYYKIITEGVIILKWGFNKCFPEQALMAVINLLTCSSQTSAQLPRSCVWKLCVLHVDTYCITE